MRASSSIRRDRGVGLAFAAAIAAFGWADSARGETTTSPVAREGSWRVVHDSFVERAKKGDVDLLFLGDSITEGWGDNPIWRRYYGPRKAANFGIGGDGTQHVLWRIQNGELDGIRPKVVVLMIGTNNVGGHSADAIADGIRAIVKTLRQKLPETKVLLLGVFPRGEKPNPIRETLKAVNVQIAKLDDGKVVTYLDLGKHFVNDDGTIPQEIMPDFVHLSRQGYRIWADSMEPTLWRLLDEETVNPKGKTASR